jgi:hypothetical protein
MAAFSVFWAAVALRPVQSPYGIDQRGIALFALAGAGGATVTPLAGRAGNRGWTRLATVASHLLLIAALALAASAELVRFAFSWMPLALMTVSAVLLDMGEPRSRAGSRKRSEESLEPVKVLGFTVPLTLLAFADEVIE